MDIKNIDKYYNKIIKKCTQHKKSSYYKITQKLYYSTHLDGPHIEFFNSPPSLNKINLFDNLKKFQKKIVTSISYFIHCEKAECYLHSKVVDAMIQQTDKILSMNLHYWENHGFISADIDIINKTYQMYKLFLETYLVRITPNKSQLKPKLYSACLFNNFCTNVDPLKILDFGIARIKQLTNEINEIKKTTTTVSPQIKTDTELFSTAMTIILDLHNNNHNNNQNKTLVYPEPHKIKIKQISLLFDKFDFDSVVTGRHIILNDMNPQLYTHDDLLLICAHDSIGGVMTTKLNTSRHMSTMTNKYYSNHQNENNTHRRNVEKIIETMPYYHEGLACLSEESVVNKLDTKLSILSKQLIRSVLAVVDVGLHYNNIKLTFNIESATKFIKGLTTLTDLQINSCLLKILASPGYMCTQELARYVMNNNKKDLENLGYNFYDIIYRTPFDMTTMANFIADLKK